MPSTPRDSVSEATDNDKEIDSLVINNTQKITNQENAYDIQVDWNIVTSTLRCLKTELADLESVVTSTTATEYVDRLDEFGDDFENDQMEQLIENFEEENFK